MKPHRRAGAGVPDWHLCLLVGLGEVGHALDGPLGMPPAHATVPLGSPGIIGKGAGWCHGERAGGRRAAPVAGTVARAVELNRRAVAALEDLV